jgi:hypothetical protein
MDEGNCMEEPPVTSSTPPHPACSARHPLPPRRVCDPSARAEDFESARPVTIGNNRWSAREKDGAEGRWSLGSGSMQNDMGSGQRAATQEVRFPAHQEVAPSDRGVFLPPWRRSADCSREGRGLGDSRDCHASERAEGAAKNSERWLGGKTGDRCEKEPGNRLGGIRRPGGGAQWTGQPTTP